MQNLLVWCFAHRGVTAGVGVSKGIFGAFTPEKDNYIQYVHIL